MSRIIIYDVKRSKLASEADLLRPVDAAHPPCPDPGPTQHSDSALQGTIPRFARWRFAAFRRGGAAAHEPITPEIG